MGKIVIGVLTWNGYELARACLQSLTTLREWPVPVVVVDNGSSEPEGERLADEFGPSVSAVRLTRNAAVAGGYNAAIRWASEHDATHVLLLNNDTLVNDPDLLTRLVAATSPAVAAVGPIMLDSSRRPYSAGGRVHWTTGWSEHSRTPRTSDGPYPVDWLDGACILVSVDAVRKVGGLDAVYVSYWEDVDWCIRAGQAGYQCLVEPRASMVHLGGGSIPQSEAHGYDLRNRILFMRRNGGAIDNVSSFGYFVVRRLGGLILGWLHFRGREATGLGAALDPIIWNVRDAIRQRRWRLQGSGPSIGEMPHADAPGVAVPG